VKFIVRCLVLASLLLESCYGRSQEVDASSVSDNRGIAFDQSAGYLVVVEGRIESLSNLRFVLDTGATRSVVDRRIADRLRVPRQQGKHAVFSFDRTANLEQAEFHDVQFGPVQLANLTMLVADLPRFSDFGGNVDVLIGMDLLRMRNFAIDYDSRKVLFSPLDHVASAAVPDSSPLFFTVEILIQGHPVHLIVDTGVEGVLLYEDRLLENVPNLRIEGGTKATSLGKRLRAKWATLPGVSIGASKSDTRVLLMNATPGQFLRGIDGYIGMASLRARCIEFNFTTKTLTLRR
jgi:predicted aspartyl protease